MEKYLGFNVSFLGITDGKGLFHFNGPEEQGFIAFDGVHTWLEDYTQQIAIAPKNGVFTFSVDCGFYGEQDFCVNMEGETAVPHKEKLSAFFDGFKNAKIDEKGIAKHPLTGLQFFPAAQ